MSKQQLDLLGSSAAKKWTDAALVNQAMAGEIDIAAALKLGAADLMAMRRQAVALSEAGKWQRCVDVVLGIVALGEVHPVDAVLLARSFHALGKDDEAERCADHARLLFDAMGLVVPEWLGSGEAS